MSTKRTFLYFSYCVNMLSSRMECCVDKSAARRGLGKLEGHTLLFGSYNRIWEGTLPSIVKAKDKSSVVWGSLWEIEECYRPKLDILQGVASKVYEPIDVDITALKAKGGTFKALSYRLAKEPTVPELYKGWPKMRYRPSKLYLDEFLEASEEACLPIYYRKWLRATFLSNGYSGSVKPNLTQEIEPDYP